MSRSHGLTKSRYQQGLQCHRQLWWRVHEPDAPELVPDGELQARLDEGSRVGVAARLRFPGGTLIDPGLGFEQRLSATREAMASDAPAIFEAAFQAEGVFVAVDVLRRDRGGWRVIEVKSATAVKDQYHADVAIQLFVLRHAGVPVTGADIMLLDRACEFPDLDGLFAAFDDSDLAGRLLPEVPRHVREQLDGLAGALPGIVPGCDCEKPYPCPFRSRCWPALPPHHVSTLFRMKDAVAGFIAGNKHTIRDLDESAMTNPQARRQCRAVKTNRLVVEGDLAGALERFAGPLAFLDFETLGPAIPLWDGCHPYDHVPAQFSCHVELPGGGLAHHEWVAAGPEDPRPEVARRVIAACAGARTVVAYNASFEKGCLERMAKALPAHAAALRDVVARLADPLPVVREHVYHPDFGGSFSLKTVLPALVPDMNYEGLAIADGGAAMLALGRIVFDGAALPDAERESLREALLRYCERDTLAMVRVLERLREIAAGR